MTVERFIEVEDKIGYENVKAVLFSYIKDILNHSYFKVEYILELESSKYNVEVMTDKGYIPLCKIEIFRQLVIINGRVIPKSIYFLNADTTIGRKYKNYINIESFYSLLENYYRIWKINQLLT